MRELGTDPGYFQRLPSASTASDPHKFGTDFIIVWSDPQPDLFVGGHSWILSRSRHDSRSTNPDRTHGHRTERHFLGEKTDRVAFPLEGEDVEERVVGGHRQTRHLAQFQVVDDRAVVACLDLLFHFRVKLQRPILSRILPEWINGHFRFPSTWVLHAGRTYQVKYSSNLDSWFATLAGRATASGDQVPWLDTA
jgi:hypothetical protein